MICLPEKSSMIIKFSQQSFKCKLIIFTAAVVMFWVVAWVIMHTVTWRIITAAYNQKLPFEVLNTIIQGQNVHPVSHYIAYANGLFIRASVFLAGCLAAGWLLAAIVMVSAPKLKKAVIIIVVNMLIIFVADRLLGRLLSLHPDRGTTYSERVVRLKKHHPHMDISFEPSTGYLAQTDGLIPDTFRLRTDERGFIRPSDRHIDPDLRVFFVGGSTTECKYVQETNRFPIATATLLEQKTGLDINAYNAGVSGNNSLHSLNIILNDIIPLEPDIIVFMHNVNDLVILLYTGTFWNDNFNRSPIKEINVQVRPPPSVRGVVSEAVRWLMPHSYRKLHEALFQHPAEIDEWQDIRGHDIIISETAVLREFTANLRTFVALCRNRNIRPVLMTQQSRYTAVPDEYIAGQMQKIEAGFGIKYAKWYELYAMLNERIRLVADEEGVLLVDLDMLIPKSQDFIYDTVHFNDRGSLLAADYIAKALGDLPEIR